MVSSDASWTLQLEFWCFFLAAQPSKLHQVHRNHDDGHFSQCSPFNVQSIALIISFSQPSHLNWNSFHISSFLNLHLRFYFYSRASWRKDLENHSTIASFTFKRVMRKPSAQLFPIKHRTNDLCFAERARHSKINLDRGRNNGRLATYIFMIVFPARSLRVSRDFNSLRCRCCCALLVMIAGLSQIKQTKTYCWFYYLWATHWREPQKKCSTFTTTFSLRPLNFFFLLSLLRNCKKLLFNFHSNFLLFFKSNRR